MKKAPAQGAFFIAGEVSPRTPSDAICSETVAPLCAVRRPLCACRGFSFHLFRFGQNIANSASLFSSKNQSFPTDIFLRRS
jgi:hypothetical protein